MGRILIIGSEGQLGGELFNAITKKHGTDSVVCSDLLNKFPDKKRIFEALDGTDKDAIRRAIKKHEVTVVYQLAAILSAKGEQNPMQAWDINMMALLNVLELGVEMKLAQVYWPSSIAAFGPNTPTTNTPQYTIMDPSTVYGMSKMVGELWCRYYFDRYGLDVRSLRYPGIISFKTPPGGGTTDYAIEIFHAAVKGEKYSCFLGPNTSLPMMYIDDAIRATLELMEAPKEKIKNRTSYNLAAISFTPEEIANEIKKQFPAFTWDYKPDFRQKIADSWPRSINDAEARKDWKWKHKYDLAKMVDVMINGVKSL